MNKTGWFGIKASGSFGKFGVTVYLSDFLQLFLDLAGKWTENCNQAIDGATKFHIQPGRLPLHSHEIGRV